MEENQTHQEKVFYKDNNVTVTQSRFIADNKTYAMRNISTVAVSEVADKHLFERIMLFIGILLAIADGSTRIAGVLLIVGGLALMMFKKTKYAVRISTNAGEVNSMISNDKVYIQEIVNALNDAIIQRG